MDSKAPRLLATRPRKCVLRRGLSPRRSKFRGVMYSSPGSHSLPSVSYTPSATPTSFTTMESSKSDFHSPRQANYKEFPRTLKHGVKCTSYSDTSNTKHFPETTVNEIQSGHVPNEMHLKKNTPTPFSDAHKSTGMVIEEGQPTRYTLCTRASASNRNTINSKQQPGGHIESSAKRALSMESPEKTSYSKVEVNLKKKSKSQKSLSMRRDALLRETIDFITSKTEEINSHSTCCTEQELCVMVQDAKLILESLSCLDSLL